KKFIIMLLGRASGELPRSLLQSRLEKMFSTWVPRRVLTQRDLARSRTFSTTDQVKPRLRIAHLRRQLNLVNLRTSGGSHSQLIRAWGEDVRQIVNPLIAPGVALALCNPFLAAALAGNAQAFGEFGAIGNEWQDFMRQRLKEDVALWDRL